MKALLTTLLLLGSIILFAQEDPPLDEHTPQMLRTAFCQTMDYHSSLSRDPIPVPSIHCSLTPCDDSLLLYSRYPVANIPIKTIQIRWVIFNDDGQPIFEDALIDQYMDSLNTIFLPYRFQFDLFEVVHQTDEIANHAPLDAWRSGSFYPSYSENKEEMINLFVVSDFGGLLSAFANFPFDILPVWNTEADPAALGTIVTARDFIDGLGSSPSETIEVVAHELGHIFGLLHTFEFSFSCEILCRETVAENANGRAVFPYNSGDFVGDTHPLWIFSNWENCSLLEDTLIDHCVELPLTYTANDQHNFMSYFKCKELFTTEQALRMHCIAETYYPAYYDNISSTEIVEDTVDPLLHVFPNPVIDVLNISMDGLDLSSSAEVLIYNTQGQQVSVEWSDSSSINVGILSSGVYVVVVAIDSTIQSATFVKD